MTSVLPQDDRNAARMKPKSASQKVAIDATGAAIVRDETRSFLNFSRENLSMSHSELEQGFNKPSRCFRLSRQSLLSITAILLALACAGIEIWKLHRVVTNGREIEILKRDVESLRHRLFGEDFMDELNAFEEQLYADGADAGEDSGEADSDYESNYDEDYWSDYVGVSREPTAGTGSSIPGSPSPPKNAELKSTLASASTRDRDLVEMLAVLHKVEAKRGQEFEKSVHETRKNIARERLAEGGKDSSRERGNKRRSDPEHEKIKDDHPKRRRAVTEEMPIGYTVGVPIFSALQTHDDRNHTNDETLENSAATEQSKIVTTEASLRERHPPKKYFALTGTTNSAVSRRHSVYSQRKGLRRFHQNSEISRRSLKPRGMTKRHLRAPRQVFAAHYGADSSLFGMDDEHTGNGRAKHNEGIFKAWQPSDWVSDLGMSRHFTLSRDGRLTVHEPGLYLVYAQIHYLDEHDENGFHMLVNGQPIMQCMVYSPGTGHKSRSCFSAQVTVLQAGDRLILKDVGPARYTLFQRDKSFFGLVKLGDSRQQQQQSRHTTQSPETER